MTFKESFLEEEPTAPGGGQMRWTVEVEEPDVLIGARCAMIHIAEDTTANSEQDALLLCLNDAQRLCDLLQRAIQFGRAAERAAEITAVVRSDHARGRAYKREVNRGTTDLATEALDALAHNERARRILRDGLKWLCLAIPLCLVIESLR